MPDTKKYRCLNCGHRFEVDVLTRDERRELEEKNEPIYAISCPECSHTNYREGWE